jgi:hypothetical protein
VHEPIEVKFKISVAWSRPLSIVLSTDIRLLIFHIYTFHIIIMLLFIYIFSILFFVKVLKKQAKHESVMNKMFVIPIYHEKNSLLGSASKRIGAYEPSVLNSELINL